MTITTTTTTVTIDEVLTSVQRLAPGIAERSAEIESARRLPGDLLDDLRAAGCFKLLLPQTHGGIEAELAPALRVLEALAAADGSVGWTVMIGAGSWCDLASLPRASFDELFSEPDVIVAGAFNPTGSIIPCDVGRYRVSGRWAFASGCEHATWVFGNCVEAVVDGTPKLRLAVFAPDQVTIEDTWRVAGLSGTGSHHFHVKELSVAADRTLDPFGDPPCVDVALVRIPPPALYGLAMAAVALGIAGAALDDIVGLAEGKMPILASSPLATNPRFQLELATADTDHRAARALLCETAEEIWTTADDGQAFTPQQVARARATAVWVAEHAAAVVTAAYRAGGGSSPYLDCPLQRRLRDICTLGQHFLVRRDALVSSGALLAGQEVPSPVF